MAFLDWKDSFFAPQTAVRIHRYLFGAIGIVSLLAGILILIMPRLLNFIVAIYLIVIGIIGLLGASNYRF